MKRTTLAVAILALAPAIAVANGPQGAQNTAAAAAAAKSAAKASSASTASATGGTGIGTGIGIGGAGGAGGSLSLSMPEIPAYRTLTVNGRTQVENVPSVFGGNVFPTAPCMGSSQAGGAGVGFGFSVGTSWRDDDCGIRETARSFAAMGLAADALAVLCSSEYAQAAPSCGKAAPSKQAPAANEWRGGE